MSDHAPDQPLPRVAYDDYARLDIRVGTILSVDPFAAARTPAWQLTIDFGPLGTRRSSAQITKYYDAEALVGQQVACVVNFPPKRIAGFTSEVLVLGAVLQPADVVLLFPDRPVPNGTRVA